MSNEGYAAIGIGSARGRNAAETATRNAISFRSLNEWNLRCASRIWVLIEGAPELIKLRQVVEISHLIQEFLSVSTAVADPVYFYGAIRNKAMEDDFRVTILASGIPKEY
jgi:cell division GTPase FtsZ